jgi:hypothetical protein
MLNVSMGKILKDVQCVNLVNVLLLIMNVISVQQKLEKNANLRILNRTRKHNVKQKVITMYLKVIVKFPVILVLMELIFCLRNILVIKFLGLFLFLI